MGTSGQDRRTYAPSEEEVLAAVKSLALPSSPDAVAAAVDAMRRARGPSGGHVDGAPRASVEAVLGLLRQLRESVRVKAYAAEIWWALGTRTEEATARAELWWSVEEWRKAAASVARQDSEAQREEARREAARARGESRVRSAVDDVLEQRRRQYLAWNTLEGPGAG